MTGANHRALTASVVFGLTGHILPAAAAFYGSVFPDRIEDFAKKSVKTAHRGRSHFWIYYAWIILLCSLPTGGEWLVNIDFDDFNNATVGTGAKLAAYFLMWFSVGCLCHIAEDFLCGGAPLVSPRQRIGFRIFKTGSAAESFFVAVVSLFALWLRWRTGIFYGL